MRSAAMAAVLLILANSLVAQDGNSSKSPRSTRKLTYSLYRSVDHGASWSMVGARLPESKRINALAVADAVSFAATDNGIFTSIDGGQSWSTSAIMLSTRFQCLVVKGRRVYAGTSNKGVLVTEDDGRSWKRAGRGLDETNVRSLAIQGAVVYALRRRFVADIKRL